MTTDDTLISRARKYMAAQGRLDLKLAATIRILVDVNNWTHVRAAMELGKSRSWIANYARVGRAAHTGELSCHEVRTYGVDKCALILRGLGNGVDLRKMMGEAGIVKATHSHLSYYARGENTETTVAVVFHVPVSRYDDFRDMMVENGATPMGNSRLRGKEAALLNLLKKEPV